MVQTNSSDESGSSMLDWLEQYDKNVGNLYAGQILNGTVMEVRPDEVLIDIGAKAEGIVTSKELDQLSDEERTQLQEGAELRVYILQPENEEGHPILSISRAAMERDWEFVQEQRAQDGVFEATITGANKGGLIVHVGQLRAFIPGSQVASVRRGSETEEQYQRRLATLVGQPLKVKVLELDRRRNRLILSERAAERMRRRDRKEKLLDTLEEGTIIKGEISGLAEFGAFVDLGGADGLIHISELSWSRVEHPREVVQVGDEVEIYVLNVDHERKRIGLSLKRLQPEPWSQFTSEHDEGDEVSVVITRITNYGAFARVEGYGIEGLIHISELSDEHVENPEEVVQEGETVRATILRIEPERKRLGLSLRPNREAPNVTGSVTEETEAGEAESPQGNGVAPLEEGE